MSLPDLDKDFIFQGLDGEECEDFVFWINRRAKQEGKSRDDQWIAELAMDCMAKRALRWYIQLEPDTQESWKLLRRALMEKYPAPTEVSTQPGGSTTSNSSIPTPAAAPNTASRLYIPPSSPAAVLGYIKIVCKENPAHGGYLTGTYHSKVGLKISKSKIDAIKISAKRNHDGHFSVLSLSSAYTQFALSHCTPVYSFLVCIDGSNGGCEVPLSTTARKLLWDLTPGSHQLLSIMEDNQTKPTSIQLLVEGSSGVVLLCSDSRASRATQGWNATGYPIGEMELEAI